MLSQTLKDFENLYTDVGGYDMSYDEFKHFCRKSWEEDSECLCIDRSNKRVKGRFCVCNDNKNTYRECIPETEPSWLT